jgi:hypothetical protein
MFIKLHIWSGQRQVPPFSHRNPIWVNPSHIRSLRQHSGMVNTETSVKLHVKDRPTEVYTYIQLGDQEDADCSVCETPEEIISLIETGFSMANEPDEIPFT